MVNRREIALRSLDADPANARKDAETLFDRNSGGRPLVLMGAGNLGRRTLAGLRTLGVDVLAFADNSPPRQGTTLDGLRVLAPHEAAREYAKKAAFVVTIWGAGSSHRMSDSMMQLQSLGCDVVLPFQLLYWKHSDTFLPHYLVDTPWRIPEQKADILRAAELFTDAQSQEEFWNQLIFRMSAGYPLPYERPGFPQHFPHFIAWRDDEWIVDGGAYDGDSLRSWIAWHGTKFGYWLAIEPDPANAAAFTRAVSELPADVQKRIELNALALGAAPGTIRLDATGTAASSTAGASVTGAIEVPVYHLDGLVGDGVSFIKLDIEGAELDALRGMRETVKSRAPILSICAYHRQDHLWRVPLAIRELRDDYTLKLVPHNAEGWDLVCYAIPPARLPRLR